MTIKSLALGSAIAFALCGAAYAADTSATNSAGVAASKATTEVEKAVGAGDTFTAADIKSQVSLSTVKDGKDKFVTAKVDDMAGKIIGPVKSVETSDSGQVTAIHVDVGGWLGIGEKVVSLKPADFQYLPERNILVTKISKDEVKGMMAIKEQVATCTGLMPPCADRPSAQ